MALSKDIVLDNGITLNYHRIDSTSNITNKISIIRVVSYINKEQRNKEKEWDETHNIESVNLFLNDKCYTKDYDKNLNVDIAYEYLKTLDDFIDAKDI